MKIFTTKTNYTKTAFAFLAVLFCLIMKSEVGWGQSRTVSFSTAGTYQWVVPCGVTSINVACWGSGAGGSSSTGGGGGGAYAGTNNISVTPGTIYTVIVGAGAAPGSGSDGSFSNFRLGSTDIVAAEGGGAGTGNLAGGRALNSTGVVKFSGGNGGAHTSFNGGSGGGGSAGSLGNGGNGSASTSSTGGAGGVAGSGGGASGGDGGNNGNDGHDGNSPGAGGGEKGNGSFTSSGGGADGEVIISYSGYPSYCIPSFSTAVEAITNVTFAGINNSVPGTSGYELFCSPIGSVVQGSATNSISVSGITNGSTDFITVYIDWDQNGVFGNNTNEIYDLGTIRNAPTTITGNIAVPTAAVLGTTEMRVIKLRSSSRPDECNTSGRGQAEDYLLNVTSPCTASVAPTGANANPLTICSGTAVTLKQTGGTLGTGAIWKWYSGSCGGTLVGSSSATDASLSVNPSSTTTYYVRAEGGGCSGTTTCASITVNVNQNGTISLSSGNASPTICINNSITNIVYAIGGGATGATLTGSLPAGVTGSYSAGSFTITGTPTSSGTFSYTVATTGSSCTNPSLGGTITVNDNGTITLSSAANSDNQNVCAGNAITNITYNIGGFGTTGGTINWSPSVPPGITGNYSGGVFTISGSCATPNTYSYTVTTTGPCTNNSASGSLTVNTSGTITRTSASGTDAQSVCINNAITDITYAIGGDATGAMITAGALPAGVTGTYNGGTGIFTITGTPTTSGTFNYTLSATGSSCANFSANGSITVGATVDYGTLASGDETICNGGDPSNITFSTAPSGGSGTFTYQWYYKDGLASCPTGSSTAGWTAIGGATASSYNPPAGLTGSRTYAVLVNTIGTPNCGTATWAGNCRQVTVYAAVNFGTVASGNETICNGGDPANITLSTPPSGGAGTFSYQWYYKDGLSACPTGTSTSGWTIIGGATTNSYDPPAGLTGSRTYAVLVDVTGSPDCAIPTWASNCRQVTVAGVVNYGTVANGNETICNGGDPNNITFSTAPTGGSGTFTYQWYYQDGLVSCPTGSSTAGWTAIGGATASSYNPPTGLTNSRTYAVLVNTGGSPNCGTATWASNCRQVTVLPAINYGTVASGNESICYGGDPAIINFSTAPSGGTNTFTYQWYSRTGNITCPTGTSTSGWTSIPGATGTSYDPPAGLTTTTTYAVQVNPGGTPDCSGGTWAGNCRVVTVNALPVPALNASDAGPVCANTNITYTTNAGQSNYIWTFSGIAGTDYTIVSGGNNTSNTAVVTWLTPGTKTVTVNYTNGNGCTATTPTSNSITVLAVPTGTVTVTENSGTNPNDNIICAGDAVTFTAPAGNSYIWYVDGSIVQGPSIEGTYSTTTLANGQMVTVDVANVNNCGTTFTAPTITVNPLPTPTLTVTESSGTVNDNIICPNMPVTLTATPANATSTYSFIVNGTVVSTGAANSYTVNNISANATVAVMETNSNGCQFTTPTQNITVSPVPAGTLTVSPGNTFCAGTSVTFTANDGGTGTSYDFQVDGVSQQNSSSNTYTTNTLTNGQVVTVYVTNSSGCTTKFNSIPVTVNLLPAGTLTISENSGTPNDGTICAGTPVTFTATATPPTTGYTYDFQVNGVSKQNTGSKTYTTSGLADGDVVKVIVKSGSNCTTEFNSITVTVILSPTGTLSVSPSNTVCAGDNVTFTADPGFDNYAFQVNGITVQAGPDNTYSTTLLANGDVVSVDVTNSNSCTSTFNTITMVVNPLPTGTLAISENSGIAPDDGIICTGGAVTFTAPNGFTNYNFLLNGSSVQNSPTQKTYTTNTLANGDKVTVAVTGTGGCIALLNEYTITVNPLPAVAAITGNLNVCESGGTTTLSDATAGGVWASEDVTKATVDPSTGVVTGVAAGTVTIDYTYTNANGCSSTVTAIVTVHALPNVEPIDGNFNVCTGYTSQLTNATNTTGGTFLWSSDNTSIATVDQTGLVNGVAPGTATISYAFTDANGCTTVVSADVVVTSTPSVAAITTTSPAGFNVCIGGTLQLKDATPSGVWSSVDPTIADVSSTGVVTGFVSGPVDISYTITTSCGEMISAVQTVTVHAPPTATIDYAGKPFCTTAGAVSVTKTGSDGDGGAGVYSALPAGLSIDPSTGTITPASSTAGTYTVTYKIAAAGGCGIYTATTTVIITQAPSATISYSGSPYCSNAGTATVTRTGTAGGTYSSTAGLSIDPATGTITLSTSTAGTYTVTYTVAASGGCSIFTTTASVTVTQAPSATISYDGSPYCSNAGTATVTQTGTTGGTYTKTAGAGTLSINPSTGAIDLGASTPGTYTVTYKITGSGGCADYVTTASVTITPAPTVEAGTDVTTCSNNPPVNITAGASAANNSGVLWTSSGTGTFTNANSLTTATYAPSPADIAAGSVTLTLTANGNGNCTATTDTKTLTISAPPAAFVVTPSTTPLCLGNIQSLLASGSTPTTGSVTLSNNTNYAIPNAGLFGGAGSVTSTIAVSGIPVGAIINSVSVKFNVTHEYDNELVFNLKAPNGNVLNLVNQDGGSGNNFTNTIISSTSTNPINAGSAPFTNTYSADAANNVGAPSTSNVTNFSSLYGTPNGNWIFNAADVEYCEGFLCLGGIYTGTLNNWSITINYTVPASPLSVIWSPATDLYTDPGATIPYTGTGLSTVYAKPSSTGTKTYTATQTNAAGCSTTQTATLTVNPVPEVTITADYCAVPNKVQLTASSTPAATSYLWSTGETTQTILVDESGTYTVTAYTALSCPGTASINVANELVVNGNFENGDGGFTTLYTSRTGSYYNGSGTSGLWPEGDYAVDTSAYSGYNDFASHLPLGYHPSFHGKDHTTGHGNFMMINGAPSIRTIWTQTVNVLPNTTYYFSAWGMNLNPASPAQLQFSVNGVQTGSIGDLNTAAKPTSESQVSTSNWIRFYGTWTSGATVTSAVISIVNLNTVAGGNDFGLDDISFSTLSTFIDLVSAPGTDGQTVCVNHPIQDIVYSVGNGGSAPTVTGIPANIGITTSWSGSNLTISGTPTVPGTYSYTITGTGSCPNPPTATGTITVQQQKIALSSGTASPTICLNSVMSNIVYTVSGTATGATATGLPPGLNGSYNAVNKTFTISGAPTDATGSPYHYTITTSGSSCDPATISGDITIQAQTVTLRSGDNDNQTVCIGTPIANIRYDVGGAATGATITGLPTGVAGAYNSGIFTITGTPTDATGSPYTYTITTTGASCNTASITGKITVTPGASLSLTSGAGTNTQTVCKNAGIMPVTYDVNNGTGATISWSPSIPAGITGNYSGGVYTISGTPTAATGTYNYTVTASGGCPVAGGTATGSITVQAQTISLTAGSASPSVCANTLMPTPIVFTVGGTATGAIASGLPAGVTGSYDMATHKFTISGTPTAAPGPYSYTVTTTPATGACDPATASGIITIQGAPTGGSLVSVSICSGSSGTLTLTGQSGSIVRWEVSTDFGTTWTPIANTTISQNFTNVTATTMYRVQIGGCGTVYSSVATVGVHNLWTGRTSTDWNVTSNWSDNLLPSATCTTVMIPSGTPNQPQLTSDVTIPSINIASGTMLDLNNHTLTVNGAFSGTGTLKGSATSGLTINTSGNAGIIYFDQTTDNVTNVLKALTLKAGATGSLGNPLNITAGTGGTFGSTSGMLIANGTLNAANNLTIKSNEFGDAVVGNSSGIISGNVTVERYFPKIRAWRFVTAPVGSTQTIKEAWQENQTNQGFFATGDATDLFPGFGTEITYDNIYSHGYDYNLTNNPSIRYWNPVIGNYDPLPVGGTQTTPLNAYPGYYLFVRGSRDIDLSLGVSAGTDPTVLRAKGVLAENSAFPNHQANNAVKIASSGTTTPGQYFMMGNPYASPVNLANVIDGSRTAGYLPNEFYVWDPKIAGEFSVGGYVTYSNDVWAPINGSYPGNYGNLPIIQSGQAFLMKLDDSHTSASLEFHQEDKYPAETQVFGFGKQQQNQPAVFYANLLTSSGGLMDGVAGAFTTDNAADAAKKNASKKWNSTAGIGLYRNNAWNAIEFRPMPVLTDTLFYYLNAINTQSYTLHIITQNVPAGFLQAWLVDKYLDTKTPVVPGTDLLYNFSATKEDVNTYRNRFMLVFKRGLIATPIPVTKVANQANPGTTGNANSIAGVKGNVSVHPNPVPTGQKVLLQFTGMTEGRYEVTVTNTVGKALIQKTIVHDGGSNTYSLQTGAGWAAGSYFVKITNEKGYSLVTKLVISK